jgi:valine--pyruvate aminotransferase
MKLSRFGEKFSGKTGIVELMDDLGNALNENPQMIFMGGGNPARIEEVESLFRDRLDSVLQNSDKLHSLMGIYQSPQGDIEFLTEIAALLRKQFGWNLTERNVAISNGSQPAFFILHNILAGQMPDNSQRSIHLPLVPEYIGYSDIGLSEDFFTATRPEIELRERNFFKYRVNFSKLNIDQSIAALCVSRPTNPTGNVIADSELEELDYIAEKAGVPLIIDGAYGLPFPGILFSEARAHWNENTILVLSLSKLGMPGVRTGIVIANEEVINAFVNANTLVSLSCGNLGPSIMKGLFKSEKILALSNSAIKPFYKARMQQAVDWFRDSLRGIPYRIHQPEGAIFLWLWFEGLPISSQELYDRLKSRGVLIVPGHNFFPGIEQDWKHKDECIRVSYSQDEASVQRGVRLIGEEVRRAFAE